MMGKNQQCSVYNLTVATELKNQSILFGDEMVNSDTYDHRTLLASSDLMVLEHKATFSKTTTTVADIPENWGQLTIITRGTCAYRLESGERWHLMPEGSLAFPKTGTRFIIRKGRGLHEFITISWRKDAMPSISGLVDRLINLSSGDADSALVLPIQPASGMLAEFLGQIESQVATVAESHTYALISATAALASRRDYDRVSWWVAPGPLTKCLHQLMLEVVASPHLSWSLQEAATFAGYSPFHFSRLFKQTTGMGFHQFVDRVRTRAGAELLMKSPGPIEPISAMAGFGSPQSFRDSLRDYYGMVPSDFRTEPSAVYYS